MRLREIIKQSFKQTKSNIKFLAVFFLIVILVSLTLGFFGSDDIFSLSGFISLLLSPVIYYGITKSTLKIARNEKAQWKGLFIGLNQKTYTSFLAVAILMNLAFFILALFGGFISMASPLLGSILFLILMVVVMVAFIGVIFFPYYRLIDHGGDFWSSVKYSFNLAKGKRGFLVKFAIFAFFINIAGALLLGIGLLFTVPLTSVVIANIYEKLKINNQ
jgi:uncharacterized membrane protein